jgi:hypothetical protein
MRSARATMAPMTELEKLLLSLQRAVSVREKTNHRNDQKAYRAATESVDELVKEIKRYVAKLERDARRTRRRRQEMNMQELTIRTVMDGTAWCAVYSDFVDLPKSPYGWGDTEEEAIAELKNNYPRGRRNAKE